MAGKRSSPIGGMFAVLLLNTMLGSFLQTATSSLIPSMMGTLAVTADTAQWINTVSSLVMGMIIPASAFFIRRFRVRPLYSASHLMSVEGETLSAMCVPIPLVLTGRILQAAGSGLCTPMTQVIILTMFPENKRGTAMGIYGVASSLTPAFAPVLAGFIAERFGWQTVFMITLPVYGAVLVMSLIFMRDVLPVSRQDFDLVSFIACCVGFAGVTIGVGNLSGAGFAAVRTILPLVIGLACLTLFAERQLKAENPFLDLRVLKDSCCRWAVVASMLLYGRLIAVSSITHMYQQMVRGLVPSVSGLVLMPGSLATAFVSPIAGKIYDRYGPKKALITGAVLQLLSAAGYCLVGLETPVAVLVFLFTVQGISVSFLLMPLVTWGVSSLRTEQTAHGTAILTSLRTIAGGLGSALFMGILSSVSLAKTGQSVSLKGAQAAYLGMLLLAVLQLAVLALKVDKYVRKGRTKHDS